MKPFYTDTKDRRILSKRYISEGLIPALEKDIKITLVEDSPALDLKILGIEVYLAADGEPNEEVKAFIEAKFLDFQDYDKGNVFFQLNSNSSPAFVRDFSNFENSRLFNLNKVVVEYDLKLDSNPTQDVKIHLEMVLHYEPIYQ